MRAEINRIDRQRANLPLLPDATMQSSAGWQEKSRQQVRRDRWLLPAMAIGGMLLGGVLMAALLYVGGVRL